VIAWEAWIITTSVIYTNASDTHTHTQIGTQLIWLSTFMLLGNRVFHEAFYYFSDIVYFHYSDFNGCIG